MPEGTCLGRIFPVDPQVRQNWDHHNIGCKAYFRKCLYMQDRVNCVHFVQLSWRLENSQGIHFTKISWTGESSWNSKAKHFQKCTQEWMNVISTLGIWLDVRRICLKFDILFRSWIATNLNNCQFYLLKGIKIIRFFQKVILTIGEGLFLNF